MNDEKNKIEMLRRILNNAANMDMDEGIVLKISEMLDRHIIDYYLNNNEEMNCKTKKEATKKPTG